MAAEPANSGAPGQAGRAGYGPVHLSSSVPPLGVRVAGLLLRLPPGRVHPLPRSRRLLSPRARRRPSRRERGRAVDAKRRRSSGGRNRAEAAGMEPGAGSSRGGEIRDGAAR